MRILGYTLLVIGFLIATVWNNDRIRTLTAEADNEAMAAHKASYSFDETYSAVNGAVGKTAYQIASYYKLPMFLMLAGAISLDVRAWRRRKVSPVPPIIPPS